MVVNLTVDQILVAQIQGVQIQEVQTAETLHQARVRV
jgi:hypothetical protein